MRPVHVTPRTAAPAVDVSVVIVTYNVREFLEQSLRSVERASAGLGVETWVVDNDSADGSVEMVRERFPDVRLIDRGDGDLRKPAELGVTTKPQALVFKGEVRVPTRAQVCGDCGFVEVYATDPRALWEAYVDRLSREFGA